MDRDFIKHYEQVEADRESGYVESHRAWNAQMRSDLAEAIPQLFEIYCKHPPADYYCIEKAGAQTVGWKLYDESRDDERSYYAICLMADGSVAEIRTPWGEGRSQHFFVRQIIIEEMPDTRAWGPESRQPVRKDEQVISSLHKAVLNKFEYLPPDTVTIPWAIKNSDHYRERN